MGEENVLRAVHNEFNNTLAVDGFLVGLVGRRVDQAFSTTTLANDTATFTFSENGITLYVIRVVYTDGTRNDILHAERTA